MSSFQVRPADLDDLERLNKLMYELHDFHHTCKPEYIKSAGEIQQEKSIAKYLLEPECLVYVAFDGEQIIGFVTGQFCELVSVVSKPVQMGSVDELFVVPERRSEGIAGELLKRMEITFEEYGVTHLFVEVWEFNKKALHLYQKNGFRHHIHWLCKEIA